MSQQNKTVRFSEELHQAATLRQRRLGYHSLSDYVRALVRYDALVGGSSHPVSQPLSTRPLEDQDRLDCEILQLVQSGRDKLRGVLFEHIVERALGQGEPPRTAKEAEAAVVSMLSSLSD